MKKLFALMLAVGLSTAGFMQSAAYADGTANIRIKISTPTTSGRYYLCTDTGCLNIKAAFQGKVFSFYQPITISVLYVLDLYSKFRLTPQNVPSACQTTIQENQTMTIRGRLVPGPGGTATLQGLSCRIA